MTRINQVGYNLINNTMSLYTKRTCSDNSELYINSKSPLQEFNEVHLIYINNNKALLTDKNKQMISTSNSSHKILSDISFSNNDFVFNTLIELCPEKIHIHLINSTPDEFINTLELIFENKLTICTDCNICEIYKIRVPLNSADDASAALKVS